MNSEDSAGAGLDNTSASTLEKRQLVELPDDWAATGVLKRHTTDLPQDAPSWARLAAEVVRQEQQRFLLASGLSRGINNPELAMKAAAARARAELAHWLGTAHLIDSTVVDTWSSRDGAWSAARVRVALPDDWPPEDQ